MTELGFNVIQKKKGTYVDSHEREDIAKYFYIEWFPLAS